MGCGRWNYSKEQGQREDPLWTCSAPTKTTTVLDRLEIGRLWEAQKSDPANLGSTSLEAYSFTRRFVAQENYTRS